MSLKIGAMVESFRKNTFKEAVETAAKLGVNGLQAYATDGNFLSVDEMNDKKVAEALDILSANGLIFSAICGDMGYGFEDPEKNPFFIEKSMRIIDLAKKLNCNIVTTHIHTVPENECKQKEILRDACIKLAHYAESIGSYFALETGPEPAKRLAGFLDSLGTKGVRVNYDPANLVMCAGDDPVKGVYDLRDYIVHTHAKDGKKLSDTTYIEMPLGQGGVDFDKYLAALADIGFDGYLTIERECGDNPTADIEMAVGFLKAKKEKLGV